MNLFRFLQPAASAPMARERLQILLEYERKLGSQIDLFAVLREEILAVVGRHVSVGDHRLIPFIMVMLFANLLDRVNAAKRVR
jgi:septum formation topological specificity factor MinE